jgi:hypothetical protein
VKNNEIKYKTITVEFYKNLIIFLLFFLISKPSFSQVTDTKAIVEVGANKINLNQYFVLSITVKNEENRPKCVFPEINGFKKRSISFATLPNTSNGKTTLDQKVSQEYMPNKTGNYAGQNLKIMVNELSLPVPAFNVQVAGADQAESEDNFKDFIDGSAYDFVDVKDDAFFAITTNKQRLYVGEGFILTIAIYISKSNKAELNFFNENLQLDAVIKKIKPKNCWEENLGITEIKGNKLINIGNKKYFQYKIYQAVYYPFNNQPIVIPSQKWQMQKFKIAKDQDVSKLKKEDYKTYISKLITIKPQPIPKNTKFETDFVGDFYLEEALDNEKVQTGRSFNYNFKIIGNGSLRSIKFKESLSDTLFEIYEPHVTQQIINNLPEKSFSFNIVPKFAGKFSLKDHFQIAYFNSRSKTFEKLVATKQIEVLGKDIDIDESVVTDENDLYENIASLKSDESSFDFRKIILEFSNLLIVSMLFAMVYIFWPAKKQ